MIEELSHGYYVWETQITEVDNSYAMVNDKIFNRLQDQIYDRYIEQYPPVVAKISNQHVPIYSNENISDSRLNIPSEIIDEIGFSITPQKMTLHLAKEWFVKKFMLTGENL